MLAVDGDAAEVVRRIFAEYLAGKGDRAVAAGLNRDGIPCPSVRRPEQNRHRLADGWQGSTVRVILENPRYTGYAFFGRWTKHETLLDPEDVSAGHVVRFRRSEPERIVRSRRPAHPEIISVEDFTQAQLLRRSRGAGGMRGRAQLERSRQTGTRPYVLRGRVRCGICTRRMQAAVIRKQEVYYRCMARTLAPGSAALADHPRTVNLREFDVLESLNGWIGQLFNQDNVDRTVTALVGSQRDSLTSAPRETAQKRLADAEAKMRRFQAAIEAGVDPVALVDAINEAQAKRAAAQAEVEGAPPPPSAVSEAEVYAMIDSLGDVGAALKYADPDHLGGLYEKLNVELMYEPTGRTVIASVSPRVVSACVRGGNRTPVRGIRAQDACSWDGP
ncbi:recombinase family protein [Amycolatopsis alkalitolerans]|uniref:recombinase family protein n=1 Tax=Amycolatopsis alkalitolerans TaxID=2547244 RepID=UPI001F3030B2|nr:recombinase family protein [Amycolatopsis alkalitolerans]